MSSLTEVAQQRYTTKKYDPARTIPQDQLDQLLAVLHAAPSSVNSQPWHFVVASTPEGKARIAQGATGNFAYNGPKVTDASHVVLFCVRTNIDDDYLQQVVDKEEADGRFASAEAKANGHKTRSGYVSLHKNAGDLAEWMEKQVYLAVGELLLAAPSFGIDATPMEGLDMIAIDKELELPSQGYRALVAVALGYHSADDFNAKLPKSRLPYEQVFTHI